MKKYAFPLSQNQMQLLEYMWEHPSPQTSIEINRDFPDWKNGYIHSLLNSLTNMGYLKITGTKLIGNHRLKVYLANITREEFGARMLEALSLNQNSIPKIAMALCESSSDEDMSSVISDLKDILETFQKNIKEESEE